MCHAKAVYLAKINADQVAQKRMAKSPGLFLRSYQCPNCKFWHLTSKPRNFSAAVKSDPKP